MKLKKTTIFGGILLSLVATLVGFSGEALAYSKIEQKALGYGIYRCYVGATRGGDHIMVGKIKPSQISSYESIVLDNEWDYVALPNGFKSLHEIENSNVSCRQLFDGYNHPSFGGKFDGLFKKANVNPKPSTESAKVSFVTLMGYTADSSNASTGGECFRFKLKTYEGQVSANNANPSGSATKSAAVCTKDGAINSSSIEIKGSDNFGISFKKNGDKLTMSMFESKVNSPSIVNKEYKLKDFSDFDKLVSALSSDVSSHFSGGCQRVLTSGGSNSRSAGLTFACVDALDLFERYDYNKSAELEYSIAETTRKDEGRRRKASFTASNNLLGSSFSELTDLAFSAEEKYSLYKTYLDDFYKVNVNCDYGTSSSTTEQSLINSGYAKVPYYNGGSLQNCYVKATQNGDKNVYGLNKNNYFSGVKKSFSDVVKEMSTVVQGGGLNTEELEGVTNDNNNSNSTLDPCWNAGLESESWIVCPTLNNVQHAASFLENKLEDWLSVQSSLYDGKSATSEAWSIVRNIANVVMAVVLFVIIFSQLTGWGIDNYGIKKMLPKLILMAVAINLSFIICELAVDLSNILGRSLDMLFAAIGDKIAANGGAWASSGFITFIVGEIFAAVGVTSLAASAGSAAIMGGGAMAAIVILLAVLSIVVAILLFFAMLGVRMIIIIACIALSPIAFACYILPNTQPLFKKWWKAFETSIMIYPICGAVAGITYMIKMIVANDLAGGASPGVIMLIVALLAPYIPFFFLPTLLKGAISALGVIGGALTMLGTKMRGGVTNAQNALKKTDSYANAVGRGKDRINRMRIGMGKDGKLTARGEKLRAKAESEKGRKWGRDKLYAARLAAADKYRSESESAQEKLVNLGAKTEISGNYGGDAKRYYEDKFKDAKSRRDYSAMSSILAAAATSGYLKDKDVAEIFRNHIGNEPAGEVDSAWIRDVAAKNSGGWLGTDFEARHWAQNGGFVNGRQVALGARGDYYGTGAVQMDDVKPEDGGKQSMDSLLSMAQSGLIDSSMAGRMIESNPNLSADKKLALGLIQNGASVGADLDGFKTEIKNLLNAKFDSANGAETKINIGGIEVSKAMRDAITATTPQNVNVVQNFNAGGQQVNELKIDHSGGSSGRSSGGDPRRNWPMNDGGPYGADSGGE